MPDSDRSEATYARLGVTPIINCGGVRTFYGNSLPSERVREAMDNAARHFVVMEELAEAIGTRLAALTGAEWGMVTAGSASALALAAAACVAGDDPERMLRLPFATPDPMVALVPAQHRFSYDQALTAVGLRIGEFENVDALETMLREQQVALVCVLADRDEPSFARIVALARQHAVPVVVDAASEFLATPIAWLSQGADLVVYSVGKFMRGPSATGLLLGRERLVRAAWCNASPHQAFGRMMKIGKEQMVGALVAVEEWLARDAEADQRRWGARLARISESLADVRGVSLVFVEQHTPIPKLHVAWDRDVHPTRFVELREAMLAETPRIVIDDIGATASSMLIDPFNLADDEATIVGNGLRRFFSAPRSRDPIPRKIDITGRWNVTIEFANGERSQEIGLRDASVEFDSSRIVVTHLVERRLVRYSFAIEAFDTDTMSGTVTMGAASEHTQGPVAFGQFGAARWRAQRIG